MNEIIYCHALNESKLFSLSEKRFLLDIAGTAVKLFENSNQLKLGSEIKNKLELIHRKVHPERRSDKIFKETKKADIDIIPYTSSKYPPILKRIYDPPIIIYSKGSIIPDDRLSIAVVGARRATLYGMNYAYSVSKDLALCNVRVVSGLAIGADSAAHRGCIDGGGHTVAVLGSGILNPYPSSNKKLFEEICEKGSVISEFEPFEEPFAHNFPKRNRIVSGLSHGVFVAEAMLKSGAKITARLALEQNREVFALPGLAGSKMSEGTNELIKKGLAKLTTHSKDILIEFKYLKNDYHFETEMCKKLSNIDLSSTEKKLLNVLDKDKPTEIGMLSEKTDLSYEAILDIILNLELKGLIKREPGNAVSKEI